MNKLRDLIVLSIATAAFAASLAMFRRAVGVASPWFGVMAMLSVLGWVALARPLFLLKLPGALRKFAGWETSGRLYQLIGVRAFGNLLRRTPLRALNRFVYLTRGATPSEVAAQMESAEAAHLLAAGALVPHMVYACVREWWGAVAWLAIVQVGFNLYPMLHLRWSRIRIDRFQRRTLAGASDAG